mmetsp:Transcript_26101/g.36595  ORF Transcript_26101/g.36595 Transcript_26101/m.36595 type:complete len:109 (-) Transcript_26101:814-1140(-)
MKAWSGLLGQYIIKRTVMKKKREGKTVKMASVFKPVNDTEDPEADTKKEEEEEDHEEDDNSCWGKTIRAYEWPLFFARNLTMPPFEDEKWSKTMALLSPWFGGLFIAW